MLEPRRTAAESLSKSSSRAEIMQRHPYGSLCRSSPVFVAGACRDCRGTSFDEAMQNVCSPKGLEGVGGAAATGRRSIRSSHRMGDAFARRVARNSRGRGTARAGARPYEADTCPTSADTLLATEEKAGVGLPYIVTTAPFASRSAPPWSAISRSRALGFQRAP